ncbi:MAG: hypothetical protein ACPGUE_11180 [Marinomonas sp.]
MADITQAMQAKSDQLNAVDIMGSEPVITIRDVQVRGGDQPVWIFYHGDQNRPWKPSKGMLRILAAGWGNESNNWLGKSVQLYMEPSVKYAGQEVGGIRIRAMSDINKNGIRATLTINRQKREPYPVLYLNMQRPAYPEKQFNDAFSAMVEAMQSGKMTLEQIIARCQQTGDLTQEQMQRLSDNAPVNVEDDGEEIAFNKQEQVQQQEPKEQTKKELDGEEF